VKYKLKNCQAIKNIYQNVSIVGFVYLLIFT
jgi:hypothetical protein